MATPLRLLIVNAGSDDVSLLIRELRTAGFDPAYLLAHNEEDFIGSITPSLNIVFCKPSPGFPCEQAWSLLQECRPGVAFYALAPGISDIQACPGKFHWIATSDLNGIRAAAAKSLSEQGRTTRPVERHQNLFSSLGQRLSKATNPSAAGKIITDIADIIFGWHSCTFDTYCAERDLVERILNIDTIEGRRQDIPPSCISSTPTSRARKAIKGGGQLILRQAPIVMSDDSVPFGDVNRPSASIMFVPVRHARHVVGFLSIQSYTINAYTNEDLDTLQTLADFCGGALERIRAEETLRKSEERYRSLVSATSQMVWTTAGDGQVVEDSFTWRGYTGQKWKEFRGWGWINALHPEDVDRTLELWKAALVSKTIFQTEFRVRAAEGTFRHFAVRGAPVIEANGNVREWVTTCSDITDKKRAELRNQAFFELARNLNQARSPKQAALDIVHVADRMFGWDSCYLYLYSAKNNSVRQLITFDTCDGRKVPVALELENGPSPTMLRVLRNGPELILRAVDVPADKGMIQFGSGRSSASIIVVPARNGSEIIGFLSIQSYSANAYDHDDVNTMQALADLCGGALERLRAEEALVESEERFRSLIEHAADAIFVFDEKGAIVDANQRACITLGYTHRQLLLLNMSDLDVNFTEATRQRISAETISGEPASVESIHRRKDGSTFDVEVRVALFEWKHERLFLALVRDTTERKQLENQFRQAQKMEAFGQLAGGVAHDFNNLLTVINGYTNLLLLNDKLDLDSREHLSEISSAGEKATNLTRQLLTLSRKKDIRPQAIDLNEVVTNIMKMLKRVIGEHIQLEFTCSASLPLIEADAGMIEQVLLNLAINGRDAMPNGGILEITTSLDNIRPGNLQRSAEARVGDFICLTVRDNGCGMPLEVKARMFEPFFTTKGRKGTGLGLATVYSIVKQHRGWIDVTSELNAGTAFKIFLPISNDRDSGSKCESSETAVRGGTETILLVEDEPALRSLAKQILKRQGYNIIEAASGVKALSVWRERAGSIDLLLTDMVMPDGLNGRDLAKTLLAERPDLKVIYSTGYSVALETFECELVEGWNFLPKPYHPRKLAQTVRHRLDTPTAPPPATVRSSDLRE